MNTPMDDTSRMESDMEQGMEPGDSIEDQALWWVMRLTSGEADPALLARLEQWRAADPAHAAALADARRCWLQLGPPLERRYDPVMMSRAQPQRRARPRGRWRRPLAVAAALLLALGLGRQWASDWRYDQTTAVGEQRTLALADGSTMWLNSGSAADLGVDSRHRHVRLARGEAFFDVRHDPAHPFTVDAGIGQIKVLGTAFAVRRDGEDVLVTVQRGGVLVSGGGGPPVVITPDQQVRVHAGDAVKHVEPVNADNQLAWRSGQLVFVDRPLGEILAELRRYDRRVLLIQYPQGARQRMSAMIDLARLNEWYDGLEQSLPVRVTRAGPVVWIRQRG